MNSPLVTIFMPVYNSEKYIREALDSLVSQTYKNLEILIVDDGSTDSSLSIIKSYKDDRIRLIKNPENKGIPFNRTLALREAKGKYLANLDADDIAYSRRIEKQVQYMEEHESIDAIGSYYSEFGEGKLKNIKSKMNSSEKVKIGLLFFNPIANPTAMIRLSTLKNYNISYNPKYFVAQERKDKNTSGNINKIQERSF